MDLEIDSIHVTVTGEDWKEDEIARELQWNLTRALERIAGEGLVAETEDRNIAVLDLSPIDWASERDKTGKLVNLILEVLEA